jgi:hypothetical protein
VSGPGTRAGRILHACTDRVAEIAAGLLTDGRIIFNVLAEPEVLVNRLTTVVSALLVFSCGSSPVEPELASLAVTVSVRSMEALGEQAGSCSGTLFYGFEYEGFDMQLEGGITTGVFGGFTPGGPSLTVALMDSAGIEQLAEGWAGLDLQGGDTIQVSLRARYHRDTADYDIEVETGAPQVPDPPDSILFVGNS